MRRLLERARKRSGTSVEEIVQGLGELQPRGAGTRRSWYDWLEKPETVSALAALAALHVLGPNAAAELIFGDAGASEVGAESAAQPPPLVQEFEQVDALLGILQAQMIEVREHVGLSDGVEDRAADASDAI